MKTGYDQHFKKIKQTAKSPAVSVRLQKNKTQQKEKKSSFPVMPLFSFILIAGSGLLFLENFDSIETYFKKIEIGMATAQAEDAKPAVTSEPTQPVVNADSKAVPVEAKKIDDADYMFKLADRKKQLDQR